MMVVGEVQVNRRIRVVCRCMAAHMGVDERRGHGIRVDRQDQPARHDAAKHALILDDGHRAVKVSRARGTVPE